MCFCPNLSHQAFEFHQSTCIKEFCCFSHCCSILWVSTVCKSPLFVMLVIVVYLTSTFNSTLPKWNDGHISMYLNDTIIHVVPETQEISCNCTNEPKEKTYDITLVTQTTYEYSSPFLSDRVERLFYLQYLVTRWHGYGFVLFLIRR